MKVYGMFLLAAAMANAVSAGAGTICDMDPTPVATPSTTPGVPAVEIPVVETEAPPVVTDAPVTQDDNTQQSDVAGEADTTTPNPTDATQGPTDATQGSTDVTQGSTDVTQGSTDVTQSSGDNAQQQQQQPISGATQSTAGTVSSAYSYTGVKCGGPGSYDQVTDIGSCSKTTVTTTSPVSPLDTGVTVAFRGPMTIFNIAVFDGSNGTWSKVSSYEKGGAATNMVFLNNENIDYTGVGSPEGFCEANGAGVAKQSTPFSGTLGAATKPNSGAIIASEATGTEVHIMTENQCGVDVQCEGAYDTDGTAFQGWTGGKKVFIFKVSMENGGAPNVPAIWMLPDQVTHTGQYDCNCRGKGPVGGCGELDICEVLEKDPTVCATHYYFYDGTHNPGNDIFAPRATDGPAIYATIIDQDYGVKVIALGADDFDFSCGSITADVVSQWEAAQ